MSDLTVTANEDTIGEDSKNTHLTVNNEIKSTPNAFIDSPLQKDNDTKMNGADIPQISITEEPSDNVNNKVQTNDKPSTTEKETKPVVNPYVNEKSLGKNGIPTWYQAGWTAFSRFPNPGDEKAMNEFINTHTTQQVNDTYGDFSRPSNGDFSNDLIARYLDEKFLGEWYYNFGVVLVASFLTWILIKFHLGLIHCLCIGAIFATYYRTSVKKVRKISRDDMQREASLTNLETNYESVGWMNLFLDRFWYVFEPALAAQIMNQVDITLKSSVPEFLDVRLSTFTLGTKPPIVEGIKTFHKTAPDVVCMDWKISYIPNDNLDLSLKEVESKVNSRIVATASIGKGKYGVTIPALSIQDISFSSKLRIKLKLFNEMPHVKSVEVSFLEKPHIDFNLKLIGGPVFGSDINNIPGLTGFINDQITTILGPMMYSPNVFTLDIAALMAGGVDLHSANGVLAVTVYNGSNFKPASMFGSLDSYCTFHVNNVHNPELARTSVFENSKHPKWNETHYIILNNLNGNLCINVKDRNSNRNDSDIGAATLDLKDIKNNDNLIEGLNLIVVRSGKSVGELKADAHYFPVSQPETKEDGTIVPPEESNSGIARLYIYDCKDIGGKGKKGVNSYAIVKINGKKKLCTPVVKRSRNPRWNKDIEFFVDDKANTKVDIIIKQKIDFGDDDVIGKFSSTIEDIQYQIENKKNDWWKFSRGSGEIHLDLKWKPVHLGGLSESLGGGAYTQPIGIVRLKIKNGKGLKNADMLGTGKSDPYVRVKSGLQQRGRTEAIIDNLNPDWDTTIFIPIHSLREDLSIEVMDYNTKQSDKLLGFCELLVKDIVSEKRLENRQFVYQSLAPVIRCAELMNKDRKKGKGTIEYEAAFYPTLALAKKAKKEEDQVSSVESQQEATTVDEYPSKDLYGEVIKYTADNKVDLLSYPSGVLSVTVYEAKLPSKKNAVAELLLDSVDAQFRSAPVHGKTMNFHETGDAFVRELDLSRLVVRLRDSDSNGDGDNDDNYGYWSSPILDIVKLIQNAPPSEDRDAEPEIHEFSLFGTSNGKIKLSFKYTPVVQFTLDPNDSLENQGKLAVTAISASGLKAADSNGTSDPYCIFMLDGEKVYKTETYKKTLAPVFKKENFVALISQRRKAKLSIKIHDWDQIGSDELLAEGVIPIADLESYTAKDIEVELQEGAKIKLRLKWEPEVLARKRSGTTLIGSTAGVVTGGANLALNTGTKVVGGAIDGGAKVVGGAIDGGVKVVGGAIDGGTKVVGGAIGGGAKVVTGGTKLVGGAIGGGVNAIGRGFGKLAGRKSAEVTTTESNIDMNSVPITTTKPTIQTNAQIEKPTLDSKEDNSAEGSLTSTRPISVFNDRDKNVTIRVTLVEGRELRNSPDKLTNPYVRVRLGKQAIHKTKHTKKNCNPQWNESFTTTVFGTSTLEFIVKDHNTFTDGSIGEYTLNVSEHVDGGKPFDGWLPLSPSGTGEIRVQIEVI